MRLLRVPFRAMGSPCELRLYGEPGPRLERVAAGARAEVERLERKYTRYRDDSLTARINANAGDARGVAVDDETAGLLDYADLLFRESGGRFDLTSGILRRAWDFKSGRVPSDGEIAALLSRVGWDRVRWERPRLVLPREGMELDFGGFVKEYAADRAAELCRRRGVRHGLVDLGGDLALVGPHPDGSPWKVGVRHPRRPGRALATLPVTAGAVASSGDYERCMIVEGVRYGHVLDPRSGRPVDGLTAVTVVADHCLVAGAASTLALLLGEGEGEAWLDGLGLPNLRVDRRGRVSGTLAAADASAPRAAGSSRSRSAATA